jgi:hypothetical protein
MQIQKKKTLVRDAIKAKKNKTLEERIAALEKKVEKLSVANKAEGKNAT